MGLHMTANQDTQHPLLRHRDGHHARVTFEELLFDLVYVFAVTQLSHGLLHHLSLSGVIETLILWFAVWLGWQYTCWVTNWFDPETPRVRGLIFSLMLPALLMAASIPAAFGERGLIFASAYVLIQVGRTAFIVFQLPVTMLWQLTSDACSAGSSWRRCSGLPAPSQRVHCVSASG